MMSITQGPVAWITPSYSVPYYYNTLSMRSGRLFRSFFYSTLHRAMTKAKSQSGNGETERPTATERDLLCSSAADY